MKNISGNRSRDMLRAEYALDYAKSSPNRFAARLKDTTAIVLQPDVARVFQSADAVNDLLRSAIAATGAAPVKKQRPAIRSNGMLR
jgi:hypothetical protein